MLDVVVGLGANLGDPAAAFTTGLNAIASIGDIVAVSRLWRTRPLARLSHQLSAAADDAQHLASLATKPGEKCGLGPDQPDYCNAAALIGWPVDLPTLLQACRDFEVAAGRDRETEQRWGPRVLDLDLLMARNLIWRSPELVLPHPRFHERAFALVPAAELVPDWVHPIVGRTIAELSEEVRSADPDALISSEPFPYAPDPRQP